MLFLALQMLFVVLQTLFVAIQMMFVAKKFPLEIIRMPFAVLQNQLFSQKNSGLRINVSFIYILGYYIRALQKSLEQSKGEKLMPDFSRMSDSEILAWMDNFVTVAAPTPTDFGTTAAEVTALSAKADDLRTKMALRTTADDAADAAVTAQQTSRQSAEPEASRLNIVIKANSNIPVENKNKVGIEMPKPPTKTPPVRPENLVVNGFEDGHNTLKWSRMGNKPSTQFIIEYKLVSDVKFQYLSTTTETKYDHLGTTVGLRCFYRVKAKRAGEESTYSNEAMVY